MSAAAFNYNYCIHLFTNGARERASLCSIKLIFITAPDMRHRNPPAVIKRINSSPPRRKYKIYASRAILLAPFPRARAPGKSMQSTRCQTHDNRYRVRSLLLRSSSRYRADIIAPSRARRRSRKVSTGRVASTLDDDNRAQLLVFADPCFAKCSNQTIFAGWAAKGFRDRAVSTISNERVYRTFILIGFSGCLRGGRGG